MACHAIPGIGGTRVFEQPSVPVRISSTHESLLALEEAESNNKSLSGYSNPCGCRLVLCAFILPEWMRPKSSLSLSHDLARGEVAPILL